MLKKLNAIFLQIDKSTNDASLLTDFNTRSKRNVTKIAHHQYINNLKKRIKIIILINERFRKNKRKK